MTHVGDEAYRHIGSDWSVALILGVAAIARGISYFLDGNSLAQADFLSHTVGTNGASIIWVIAGISALFAVKSCRLRKLAISLHVALYAAWSVSLGAYFLSTEDHAVHAAAINFGLIAALVIWGLARVRITSREMPPVPRDLLEEVSADGRNAN